MRYFPRCIAFMMSLCAFSALSFPQMSSLPPVSTLLSASELDTIRAEGRIARVASGDAASQPMLVPASSASRVLKTTIAKERPNLLVEAVFFLERTTPTVPAEETRAIYGLLRSFGSLEGIEYWSASRKTWRVFYAESYRIDGPETKRRLPDETPPAEVPPSEELFAFQRDLSFGANIYRYRLSSHEGGTILLEQTNLTRMNYGLMPMLGAEGLRTRLLVIPTREGIVFYAASVADAPSLPLIRTKLENSFSNRAAALFRWFSERLLPSRVG